MLFDNNSNVELVHLGTASAFSTVHLICGEEDDTLVNISTSQE